MKNSTPTFSEFDPSHIPMQDKVVDDIYCQNDYSLGVHEMMLSGSVGCLKEDVLIETASGKVPISDITRQHYVLGLDHSNNQFCFSQGSGSFPKGKDYLYRVITKHGEFEASGNHLILTSQNVYKSVQEIYAQGELSEELFGLELKYPFYDQKSSLANVLDCWKKVEGFLYHCVKHIRQYGPQLQADLNIVLNAFPLLDDALKFDQFYVYHKPACMDDLLAMELKHVHIFEQFFRLSKLNLSALEAHLAFDEVLKNHDLKLLAHTLEGNQRLLQFLTSKDSHPQLLLYFVSKFCRVLSVVFSCESHITNTTIESIEKNSHEDWYFDIQMPKTKNYISNGLVHHNSSKSLLMAHLVVRHCLENAGARALIGRENLPDLRDTLFTKIVEHLMDENLIEGVHYKIDFRTCRVVFLINGSEIIGKSWGDGNFMKVRSLELSMACIEELTENEDQDIYNEIKMRVGRLPHIKTNNIVCATNPSGPSHWAYQYFIEPKIKDPSKFPTRHVYYSITDQNPFLPKWYIEQLKQDLDPRLARRMLYGEWIEIDQDIIYHQYKTDRNFKNVDYVVMESLPIMLCFDFNIGHGKPMSCAIGQYHPDHTFHWFDEVIIHGARTADIMEELESRGHLQYNTMYEIYGDSTGEARDTRNIFSDYDIIKRYLSNTKNRLGYFIKWVLFVPNINPPVRTRHNLVNAACLNEAGEVKFFVYKNCPVLDKGMRLTALKKGANYQEDDSPEYQHVTTAIGYCVVYRKNLTNTMRASVLK